MRGRRATLLRRIERLERRSGCGTVGPWLVINGYVDGGEATLFVGFTDGRPTLTGGAAAEWGKANGEPADVQAEEEEDEG